jgi:hypothetical protein
MVTAVVVPTALDLTSEDGESASGVHTSVRHPTMPLPAAFALGAPVLRRDRLHPCHEGTG